MTGTGSSTSLSCRWCGMIHGACCPMVKAMEFHEDGTVRRVEFMTARDMSPLLSGYQTTEIPHQGTVK